MKNLFILFFIASLSYSTTSCIKKCVHDPTPTGIRNWQSLPGTRENGSFIDVDFANSSVGYISGIGGLIVKTSDGGQTFSKLPSGTTEDLYGIHCLNSQIVLTAGNGGTILRSIDGGSSWTPIASGTSYNLRNIYFYNTTIGYITGGNGTLLKTTDGGLSWNPINPGTTDGLYGIYFTDMNTGYVSGLNGLILKTTDGGSTWTSQKSGISVGPIILESIFFTDSTHGIIAGGIGNPSFTPNPVILKTSDAGAHWTPIPCPNVNDFYVKVKFADANTGYIVGGYIEQNTGTLLKTTDGGSTWTNVSISTHRLTGIKIINSESAFAVGLNGSILKGN